MVALDVRLGTSQVLAEERGVGRDAEGTQLATSPALGLTAAGFLSLEMRTRRVWSVLKRASTHLL